MARIFALASLFQSSIILFTLGTFVQTEKHLSYLYSYCTNVTSVEKKEPLQNLCGQVTITPYYTDLLTTPWSPLINGQKLLHVKATLGPNPKTPRYLLEAVAHYDSTNAVERIYVPEKRKHKTWELNHLKAILSLLIVHPSLQPGWETDSSGTCLIAYAAVVDRSNASQTETVDKEKTKCKRIQQPIDTWNYNKIPIRAQPRTNRMMIRYRFDTVNGILKQAVAHEQQEIALFNGIDLATIQLASWQELLFVKYVKTESDVPSALPNFSAQFTEKIAEQLTQSPTRIMHLGTLYPIEQSEVACSLNTNIYHLVSGQPDSISRLPDEERLVSILRNLIENARNSLQQDQSGQVESLHTIVQLIRLLRCVPDQAAAVDVLSEASKMAPPGIEPGLLYRQYDTWRDRLVDVLVSCGTPTCVSVLLRRLEILTDMSNLAVENPNEVSTEVVQMRKMLFLTLWPALAHLSQTDNTLLERLFNSCDRVIQRPARTICLMTIVNLYSKATDVSQELENHLIDNTNDYLAIEINTKKENKQKDPASQSELNSRLLIGLTLAKTSAIPKLFASVSKLIDDTDNVAPTVRAFAIQTLPVLIESTNSGTQLAQVHRLRHRYMDLLVHSVNDTENDLVVGRALFNTILTLHPSAFELVQLVDQLALQKRWPLVRTCRMLLDHACAAEQLDKHDCDCLHGSCSGFVNFGYSGGWSGLAVAEDSGNGEATVIQGDLFNVNDSLIADYSLQVVNGPDGEFRLSNLMVDLLSAHGETRLFEFNVYTEGMNTFVSKSTRKQKKTKKKKAKLSTAWATVELNYLQTRLPPWTVFTGGLQDMIQLLWSAPSEPTTVLQVTQTAMDQRQLSCFGTGWIVRVDVLGLFSVRVDGALATSVWSQSGNSLVRVRVGAVCEIRTHVVHENFELTIPGSTKAVNLIQGIGAEATVDFVTHVQMGSLPEGICMAMNRQKGTVLLQWDAVHPVSELWLQGRSSSSYRELQNPREYHVNRQVVAGQSYDLGRNNSRRCVNLNSKTQW